MKTLQQEVQSTLHLVKKPYAAATNNPPLITGREARVNTST